MSYHTEKSRFGTCLINSALRPKSIKARLAKAVAALRWPLMATFLLISAYYVIQCPSCGSYQATSSRQTLKCKYCNKSKTLVSAKGSSKVNITATLLTPQAASLAVKAANEKRAKK